MEAIEAKAPPPGRVYYDPTLPIGPNKPASWFLERARNPDLRRQEELRKRENDIGLLIQLTNASRDVVEAALQASDHCWMSALLLLRDQQRKQSR